MPVSTNILKIFIGFIVVISVYSSDYVMCPDKNTACPDRNICCEMKSGDFSCCVDTRFCCFNGTKCCTKGDTSSVFFLQERIIESEKSNNILLNKSEKSITNSLFSKNFLDFFLSENFIKVERCLNNTINLGKFLFELKEEIKKNNLNDLNIEKLSENFIKFFESMDSVENFLGDCKEIKNDLIELKTFFYNYLKNF